MAARGTRGLWAVSGIMLALAAFTAAQADGGAGDLLPDLGAASALFWYRALTTILVGLVIWYTKKQDGRLGTLETNHTHITNEIARISYVDGEIKNLYLLINTVKDQVNRDYHTKQETTEHRRTLEKSLDEIKSMLMENNRQVTERINNLARGYVDLQIDNRQNRVGQTD